MTPTMNALLQSELFDGLTEQQAESLRALAEVVRAPAGTELFRSGAPASHLYVVLDGAVDLHMNVPEWWGIDTTRRKVSTAGVGHLVGWSAMAQPSTYSLTAVCAARTTLARFDAAGIAEAAANDPHMGQTLLSRILQVVSRRFDLLAEAVLAQRAVQASQSASGAPRAS